MGSVPVYAFRYRWHCDTVHADTTMADASGVGRKKWIFNTSGAAWQVGLTAQFSQMSERVRRLYHDAG